MTTTSPFIVIFSFGKTRPEKQSECGQSDTHDAQLQGTLPAPSGVLTFNDSEQATCLRRLAGIGTIKSAFKYTSSSSDLVLCDVEVNMPDTLPRAADILPVEFPGEDIRCRVYQDLPVLLIPKMAELHPQTSHIIVTNAMTPAPDYESDFNRWYDKEHLALLSQSPQWLSSKRYALLSATDNAPRYLAIHAWDGYEAFESEEYKHATNTEWKHKVVGGVLQRDREVYSFVGVISP